MKTVEMTDDALRNIENMFRRLEEVKNHYGPSFFSREAQMMEESLLHALHTIFLWPGKVFAEDDLSLILQSSITIGIIWHPQRTRTEDGTTVTDPLLGEWSCHS